MKMFGTNPEQMFFNMAFDWLAASQSEIVLQNGCPIAVILTETLVST